MSEVTCGVCIFGRKSYRCTGVFTTNFGAERHFGTLHLFCRSCLLDFLTDVLSLCPTSHLMGLGSSAETRGEFVRLGSEGGAAVSRLGRLREMVRGSRRRWLWDRRDVLGVISGGVAVVASGPTALAWRGTCPDGGRGLCGCPIVEPRVGALD